MNGKFFSEQARRQMDFRQYTYQGDVWVPRNLKQGDIVRADLLTDYMQNGEPEIKPRNCLVLGVDLDIDTFQLAAVRVMRLSYSINDVNENHEITLDPMDPQFRFKLTGIRYEAVLRTGKIEILTPDSINFGFAMDRPGSVSPEIFGVLRAGIEKGYTNVRSHRRAATPDLSGFENTMFVAGLDPDLWGESDAFRLAEVAEEHEA